MWKAVSFALGLLAGSSCTVLAEAKKDLDLCRGNDRAVVVPACTRIIDDNGRSSKDRATAYYVRALYSDQLERAIADYTKAIQLEPQNWLSYLQRGRVYLAQKQLDLALADVTKAFDLGPADDPYKVYLRGNVHQAKGDNDRAAADYLAAAKIANTNDAMFVAINSLLSIDRVEETADIIRRIEEPASILQLKVFRKYEKLWSNPKTNEALSLPAAHVRQIALRQAAVAKNPRSIAYKHKLIDALSKGRNYAEAERVGFEMLSTLSAHDPDPNQTLWVRGLLAKVLVWDGKLDQSKTVMDGVPSVSAQTKDLDVASQQINYSEALVAAGRYQDAVVYASRAKGQQSPAGEMLRGGNEACAKYNLGKKAEANITVDAMLKSLKEDQSVNKYLGTAEAAFEALLCLNRDAEAALLW